MNVKEVNVLVKNWGIFLQRVRKLEADISQMEIGVVPSYEVTGITGGGGKSKIETFYIKKEKKETELRDLRRKMDLICKAVSIHEGVLNNRERETVLCIINGISLRDYAKEHKIYKSYVYKIKDRAIEKIAKFTEKTSK